MEKLGKSGLIELITQELQFEVPKTQVTRVLDALGTVAVEQLKAGQRVVLPGIGTLEISERAERQGRNPATGEPMTIAASKAIRLKPIKAAKDALNS